MQLFWIKDGDTKYVIHENIITRLGETKLDENVDGFNKTRTI